MGYAETEIPFVYIYEQRYYPTSGGGMRSGRDARILGRGTAWLRSIDAAEAPVLATLVGPPGAPARSAEPSTARPPRWRRRA